MPAPAGLQQETEVCTEMEDSRQREKREVERQRHEKVFIYFNRKIPKIPSLRHDLQHLWSLVLKLRG